MPLTSLKSAIDGGFAPVVDEREVCEALRQAQEVEAEAEDKNVAKDEGG